MVIRSYLARVFRALADKLDPPGFEYRVEMGNVVDWSKLDKELRFLYRRSGA